MNRKPTSAPTAGPIHLATANASKSTPQTAEPPESARPEPRPRPCPAIHFPPHPSGTLELYDSLGGLARLFEIGALALTREKGTPENGYSQAYRTDPEGLALYRGVLGETADEINKFVTALGVALAYLPAEEIPNQISELGWLLASLGKMAGRIEHERTEIDYLLKGWA